MMEAEIRVILNKNRLNEEDFAPLRNRKDFAALIARIAE